MFVVVGRKNRITMKHPESIENYGVRLELLCEDKIQKVRQWRNDPKIQQYMVYREHITEEQQRSWFKKTNNEYNMYYIINFKGDEIGLINIKEINYETMSGEVGVFIYDDRYLNSDIGYIAHLVLLDYWFVNMNMQNVLSHILQTNQRAIRFVFFLGGIENNDEYYNYIISRDNYLNNTNRIRFLKKWNVLKNK